MAQQSLQSFTSLPLAQIGRHPAGFEAPATAHVGTVTLQVASLARSLAFYQGVLGFRLLAGSPAGSACLGAPGSERPLLVLVERPGAQPVPAQGRLGLYHFAVLLPSQADLGRLLHHLHALGVRYGATDHFVSEALYLTDPDGIQVEVYRDRPRREWQVSPEGEIRSGGQPLNGPRLLAAADSQPWAGLPAGTTIGHVHLHVNDFEQGHAFYLQGLGLTELIWSLPTASFLGAGGYHHHVGINTWAAGSPPAAADEAKLLSWEWRLPDAASLQATVESLRRVGCAATAEPAGTYLAEDPWNIRVRLAVG